VIVRPLLLLQATNTVDIDRIELGFALLLIGGQLLVLQRFHADGSITDTYNNNATALSLAVLVMLIGKGDVGTLSGECGGELGFASMG
jgi:hypothetical protein